ncbi:hypothetical protein CLU79DRAFT_8482 [Phycomyces nitens]|nr:hypothetical protein CLU79DRAFT_8482 [Phycomyces nitens]
MLSIFFHHVTINMEFSFNHIQPIISIHLTDSDTCIDLCTQGFSFNNSTFHPTLGMHKGTKIMRLFLTKLPATPRPILASQLISILFNFGTVRELGHNTLCVFPNSTGYAYLEPPPNSDRSLARISYKIPYDDHYSFFLATWTRMGAHCTYCKAMGHGSESCTVRPTDSHHCYTCGEMCYELVTNCPKTNHFGV